MRPRNTRKSRATNTRADTIGNGASSYRCRSSHCQTRAGITDSESLMPKTDMTAFAARTGELIAANAIHAICLILAFVPAPFILYYITELHLWGTDLPVHFPDHSLYGRHWYSDLCRPARRDMAAMCNRSCYCLASLYNRARSGLAAPHSHCSWYLMATLRGVACYGSTALCSYPRLGAVASQQGPAVHRQLVWPSKNHPLATNFVIGKGEYGFANDPDHQSALIARRVTSWIAVIPKESGAFTRYSGANGTRYKDGGAEHRQPRFLGLCPE